MYSASPQLHKTWRETETAPSPSGASFPLARLLFHERGDERIMMFSTRRRFFASLGISSTTASRLTTGMHGIRHTVTHAASTGWGLAPPPRDAIYRLRHPSRLPTWDGWYMYSASPQRHKTRRETETAPSPSGASFPLLLTFFSSHERGDERMFITRRRFFVSHERGDERMFITRRRFFVSLGISSTTASRLTTGIHGIRHTCRIPPSHARCVLRAGGPPREAISLPSYVSGRAHSVVTDSIEASSPTRRTGDTCPVPSMLIFSSALWRWSILTIAWVKEGQITFL